MYEVWVPSLGWEDLLEEGTATHSPTPVFFPGESQGERRLVGYGPQGHKESEMTEVTYSMPYPGKHSPE